MLALLFPSRWLNYPGAGIPATKSEKKRRSGKNREKQIFDLDRGFPRRTFFVCGRESVQVKESWENYDRGRREQSVSGQPGTQVIQRQRLCVVSVWSCYINLGDVSRGSGLVSPFNLTIPCHLCARLRLITPGEMFVSRGQILWLADKIFPRSRISSWRFQGTFPRFNGATCFWPRYGTRLGNREVNRLRQCALLPELSE